MLEVQATEPSQASPRRRLATNLAQRDTNTQYATRQAQQNAQQPNFQADGPDATTGQGIEENVDMSQQQQQQQQTPVPQVSAGPVAQLPSQSFGGAVTSQPVTGTAAPAGASNAKDLASQIVQQMFSMSKPDSAGAKGKAQDYLTRMNEQAIDAMKQSAASRGVSGGWVGGTEAEMLAGLGPQLTGAYRDIDLQDQNQYFANLLSTLGGAQALAGIDLNEQELALRRAGLGLQGEDLALRRGLAERDTQLQFLSLILGLL